MLFTESESFKFIPCIRWPSIGSQETLFKLFKIGFCQTWSVFLSSAPWCSPFGAVAVSFAWGTTAFAQVDTYKLQTRLLYKYIYVFYIACAHYIRIQAVFQLVALSVWNFAGQGNSLLFFAFFRYTLYCVIGGWLLNSVLGKRSTNCWVSCRICIWRRLPKTFACRICCYCRFFISLRCRSRFMRRCIRTLAMSTASASKVDSVAEWGAAAAAEALAVAACAAAV